MASGSRAFTFAVINGMWLPVKTELRIEVVDRAAKKDSLSALGLADIEAAPSVAWQATREQLSRPSSVEAFIQPVSDTLPPKYSVTEAWSSAQLTTVMRGLLNSSGTFDTFANDFEKAADAKAKRPYVLMKGTKVPGASLATFIQEPWQVNACTLRVSLPASQRCAIVVQQLSTVRLTKSLALATKPKRLLDILDAVRTQLPLRAPFDLFTPSVRGHTTLLFPSDDDLEVLCKCRMEIEGGQNKRAPTEKQ